MKTAILTDYVTDLFQQTLPNLRRAEAKATQWITFKFQRNYRHYRSQITAKAFQGTRQLAHLVQGPLYQVLAFIPRLKALWYVAFSISSSLNLTIILLGTELALEEDQGGYSQHPTIIMIRIGKGVRRLMDILSVCSYEPANRDISLSKISPNPRFPIQNVFFVHMRKWASEISFEHCRDLGKRAKKVLKATPKVLADIRIMLKLSRDSQGWR